MTPVATRRPPDDNGTTANRVGNVTSGLAAYSGTWSQWEAAHLLRRTGFGAKKTDIDQLLTMTVTDAVDAICNISATPPAPPVNHYQNTLNDTGGIAYGADWTSSGLNGSNTNDNNVDSYRAQSFRSWWMGLCINSDMTIREKMVLFWYHFIPVDTDDIRNAPYTYISYNGARVCYNYLKLLRDNALGNFNTLIRAIAKSPAMMAFLGNQSNTATAPNENFARELLELFMMGKAPVQNYIEADVQAGAKVLTGWRTDNYSLQPVTTSFYSGSHSTSNKTFSAYFGNTTITGLTGSAGANEFDTFFNMIFSQQGTTVAAYICRRLYRFFVYYDIDANVETNVIAPLATSLIANNWDILPVLKQLLKSEHFFDMANRGVMIKSPADLSAGMLRTFNIPTTAATTANQYTVWNYFNAFGLTNLEQGLGNVPNVSGWKAYYQTPGYYQNWINTNTIQQRAKLLTNFTNGISSGGLSIKIDPIAFAQQFPNATIQDPDQLVNACVKYLLPVDLAQTYKDQIKQQNLLTGQVTNSYWTTAWNNYTGNPTTSNTNTVKTRLSGLLTAIIQLAEFQLM